MKKRKTFLFLLICGLISYCGGGKDETSDYSIHEETPQKFALFTVTSREKEKNEYLEAKGVFFSYKGLRLKDIFTSLNLSILSLADEMEINTCNIERKKTGLYPLNSFKDATVELFDGGNILFDLRNKQIFMDILNFPEITSKIFGIIYEINEINVSFDSERKITIVGDGSLETGSFIINSRVPPPFELIASEKFVTKNGEEFLSILWNNSDPQSDLFIIEIPFYGYDEITTLFCRVDDDGEFALETSKLLQLPLKSDGNPLKIIANRIKIIQFFTSGIDEGWIVTKYQDEFKLKK